MRKVASDELEEPERVGIGGVDVVEDEQERTHGRRLAEDRGDVVEQGEPAGDDRLFVDVGIAVERRELRHDGGHPSQQRFLGVAVGPAEPVVHERAEHLGPRPERRCTAVFPAAPPQHREAGATGVFAQGGGEVGLADPGSPSSRNSRPCPAATAGRIPTSSPSSRCRPTRVAAAPPVIPPPHGSGPPDP